MRLSEAIRLGSMMRPQARGGLYEVRERPMHVNSVLGLIAVDRIASCAFGAAIEAAGCSSRLTTKEEQQELLEVGQQPFRGEQSTSQTELIMLPAEWTPVTSCSSNCPACDYSDFMYRLIPHLNDEHVWTREQIADFIEQIEDALISLEVEEFVVQIG